MESSFFGFQTEAPVLGAGKMVGGDMVYDESEIDLMNDETFGDGAVYGDDWEEQHEKLAGELESFAAGDLGFHHGYSGHLGRNGADSRGESPETDLEHSINQLVVDDEEDSMTGRGRPIPGRRLPVDLDNLFGPGSPPGLFGAEDLVAGQQNIWGSPNAQENFVQQQDEGLKMLLKQMQSKASTNQMPTHPGFPPGGGGAGELRMLPNSLPEAVTLEEIEGRISAPRKAMTLEELERQLTHPPPVPRPGMPTSGQRIPSPVQPGLPLPIGTPPQRAFASQPNVVNIAGQKHISPTGIQMVPQNIQEKNERSSPVYRKSPSDSVSPHTMKSAITTPTQQRIPHQGPNTDPSHTRGRGSHHQANQSFSRQSLFQDREHRNSYDDRYDTRRGGYHSRGGGHRGYYHQNGERGYYQRNGERGGYHGDRGGEKGSYGERNGERRGNYTSEWEWKKRGHDQHSYNNKHPRHSVGPHGDNEDHELGENDDEYAGLMSRREKDWIIKIQLMQLQTENPYLDDYYYTVWQIKKLAQERKQETEKMADGESEPALVLPQLAGRVDCKHYTPIQFDNALGKLTAASVHNPRQIIDVKRDCAHEKEDAKGREVRRFKQLLLDIEQAYDLLLIVDDMEKRALALPPEARPSILESRKQAVHSLYLGMRVAEQENDFFRRVINVRKGIKLISRLLAMVQQSEAVILIDHLFQYLSDISKKSWQKDVLPLLLTSIKESLVTCKLEDMVKYATTLQENGDTISLALQNQFGMSVIWRMLQRGESIYVKESPLDLDVDDQKKWREFVEQVAENLSSLSESLDHELPAEQSKVVQAHFRRLLDRGLYLAIEDRVQQLCDIKSS